MVSLSITQNGLETIITCVRCYQNFKNRCSELLIIILTMFTGQRPIPIVNIPPGKFRNKLTTGYRCLGRHVECYGSFKLGSLGF